MNINPLIESALDSVGCPVSPIKHNGSEDTYIVYYTLLEQGELFSDDDVIAEGTYGTVTVFSKKNFKALVKSVKQKLKQVGFTIRSSGPETLDNNYYCYPIEIYIEGMEE